MSGYKDFNYPAFRAAAEDLRGRVYNPAHTAGRRLVPAAGERYEVVSPVELDEADGFDPAAYDKGRGQLDAGKYADFLSRDIHVLATQGIEAVVVLPGWERSGGARTEVAFAQALDLPILSYPTLEPIERTAISAAASTADREIRVTDPDTGGQKGRKPERMDLLPPAPLAELSRVYGFGAEKYDDFNYLLGYRWRLSLGALLRHINAWALGEDLDTESGLHHLAHAAWHCNTLQMFQLHELGVDDRIGAWLNAQPTPTELSTPVDAVEAAMTDG